MSHRPRAEAYYGAERFKFSSFSNATVVAMKANGCAQLHVDRLDPVAWHVRHLRCLSEVVGESYCEGNQESLQSRADDTPIEHLVHWTIF